ncbi:MAG TPA: CPBP family intramembrane metalloprotease [Tissierellia bacterium]|nr:CPBP family intramembrane metalloprotease [Tissierellia bacterium]
MHPTRTVWYFFILCLVNIFAAGLIQAAGGYAGLVISQVLFFLLPAIWIAKRRGGVLEFLRIKEVPVSAFFWAFLLSVLAIPISTFVNAIVILVFEQLGMQHFVSLDVTEATLSPAIMLIIFAVVPGICEELMFRGMFLRSLDEKLPLKTAIILSSVFFGIIHFNIYNFLSPVYLGILFSLLVHIYDSIIPAILGHTFFNAIVYYVQMTVSVPEEAASELTLTNVIELAPMTLLAIVSTLFILRRLYQRKKMNQELIPVGEVEADMEMLERRWEEIPLDVDDYREEKEQQPQTFAKLPGSAWVPLILSVALFGAMVALMERVLRMMNV